MSAGTTLEGPGTTVLRPATRRDAAWIAELRAAAMRPDLERLGRYNRVFVRRRFLDSFDPADARVLELDGRAIGVIAMRVAGERAWIEHFFLEPALQGRGLGSILLADALARVDALGLDCELIALAESGSIRLYLRHGFLPTHLDGVDQHMLRAGAGRN